MSLSLMEKTGLLVENLDLYLVFDKLHTNLYAKVQ